MTVVLSGLHTFGAVQGPGPRIGPHGVENIDSGHARQDIFYSPWRAPLGRHQLGYSVPELWFEKLSDWVGLPNWAGAICFGWAPFLLLSLLPALASAFPPPTVIFLNAFDLVFAVFAFQTASYLRRELTRLLKFVDEIHGGLTGASTQLDLSHFSSARRVILVYLVTLAFVVPLFTLGQTGISLPVALEGEVPFFWFNFVFATFLWTFGYSMYSIYKMGKLPLKLRPYTEDRTLGLRPFGKASLNSTLIYVGVVSTVVIPVIFQGFLPLELSLAFLILYPVGFLLFLFPLLSMHSRLVDAKKQELAWIGPRATVLLQRVKASGNDQIDDRTANEISVLDMLKREAQQIHTWPFDTGILARLLAVLLTVVGILISGIIRNLLHF